MRNPILSQLRQNNNPIANAIGASNGNVEAMYSQMMRTNPQFARFVHDNQGKSLEQICGDYGVDPNVARRFLR